MQSKQDNPESFYWFQKAFEEQQQQQQQPSASDQPDATHTIDLLRFIKVFTPTVDKLMELCKTELEIPLLAATKILDDLEKNGEIQFEESAVSNSSPNTNKMTERTVNITPKGLTRLETGA